MDAMALFARASSGGDCTKETCPPEMSVYGYAPSRTFNLFFTGFFAISGLIYYHQSFLWTKWRWFSLVCALGAFMECGGYVGRLMLHNDPFSDMGFKLNVVLLTVAPAFISGAIYLILKKAVIVFGRRFSRLPAAYYAYIFVSCDIVSIILQGAGGAISAIATEKTFLDQGVDIMIAGLASQIFTLLVFFLLCIDFFVQCYRNKHELNPGSLALVRENRFQIFVGAVTFAFLCIFLRCCYRLAELSGGWGNPIMRKEGEFIIMDSDMCTLAWLAVQIFHPGAFFPDPAVELIDEKKKSVRWQDAEVVGGHASVCQRCGFRQGNWI